VARVLIAGCGYVGTALALRLARSGHTTFALRRRPQGIEGGVRELAGDLARPASLAAVVPEPVDAVCYTAASDSSDPDAYRAAYVTGLTNLLACMERAARPPTRLVLCSSTAVYAQCHGEWVDEDSATRPQRFQGITMLDSERIALGAAVDAVVVRFGGIYGPSRTRMLERIRAGDVPVGEAPQYTNRIHRDDCAGVLEHLLFLPDPAPVYLGVDHSPADRREVTEWLARRLGAPRPPVQASADADQGKRCSNRRLLGSGYRFTYPTFREGYEQVLATLAG